MTLVDQTVEPEGVFQPKFTDYSNVDSYNFDAAGPAGRIRHHFGSLRHTGCGGYAESAPDSCVPPPTPSAEETPCARQILSQLARRAYRRPLEEPDLQTVMAFYTAGRSQGQERLSFERGIETALRRILVDPEFLFRFERDPANVAPTTAYHISDLELASRLSFFLWSSLPDDELLKVAERGDLRDPAMLEYQVRRMLADGRSRALVDNFAGQWLYLRNVAAVWPNPEVFPDFVANLRDDFGRETELFFESMLREDRSVVDLIGADYTFLNERLAQHYGVPGVVGNNFRRVTLSDENRKGLLGQGSVLTVDVVCHPDRAYDSRKVAPRKHPGRPAPAPAAERTLPG